MAALAAMRIAQRSRGGLVGGLLSEGEYLGIRKSISSACRSVVDVASNETGTPWTVVVMTREPLRCGAPSS